MSQEQATGPVGPMNTVGHNFPRIDAYERVTGKATYTGDVQLPGMLYARLLRSPHPHARIRSVDVSRAQALPGVRAGRHARDTPADLRLRFDRGRSTVQRRRQGDHQTRSVHVRQPGPLRRPAGGRGGCGRSARGRGGAPAHRHRLPRAAFRDRSRAGAGAGGSCHLARGQPRVGL